MLFQESFCVIYRLVYVCVCVCLRVCGVQLGHNLKCRLLSKSFKNRKLHHSEPWISHLLNEINGDYFEGLFLGLMAVIPNLHDRHAKDVTFY